MQLQIRGSDSVQKTFPGKYPLHVNIEADTCVEKAVNNYWKVSTEVIS